MASFLSLIRKQTKSVGGVAEIHASPDAVHVSVMDSMTKGLMGTVSLNRLEARELRDQLNEKMPAENSPLLVEKFPDGDTYVGVSIEGAAFRGCYDVILYTAGSPVNVATVVERGCPAIDFVSTVHNHRDRLRAKVLAKLGRPTERP